MEQPIRSPVSTPIAKYLCVRPRNGAIPVTLTRHTQKEDAMRKILLVAAATCALAAPALADEVGVRVGPVGAGVTVGEGRHDYDRNRVEEKTVIKRDEPDRDRTTVIKKEDSDGNRGKTVIHQNDERFSL